MTEETVRMPGTRASALLHAAWSLGWASARTLVGLVYPWGAQGQQTVHRMQADGLLERARLRGPGLRDIYGVGPRAAALDPAFRRPWRPPLTQIAHTRACGETLVALRRPGLLGALTVIGWAGEAELRAEAGPGEPYPDAAVEVAGAGGAQLRVLLEVDRGTEGRAAFRRKLARYHALGTGEPVLAVTPTEARARTLARHATVLGVPLLACPRSVLDGRSPLVYDVSVRARRPLAEVLGEALGAGPAGGTLGPPPSLS